jgi:hypothetical protein
MSSLIEDSTASAFLVVVAKSTHAIPAHVVDLARQLNPPGLHFVATETRVRRYAGDQFLLAAWGRSGSFGGPRWFEDANGSTTVAGHYRPLGEPWPESADAARTFADIATANGLGDALSESDGAFTVASVGESGGYVASDRLGFGFLFHGETDRISVFGSRAELVARAITAEGRRPEKDALAGCWTVLAPYAIGDRTGFVGVRLLPEACDVQLKAGADPVVMEKPAPWLDHGDLSAADPDEVLDVIARTIEQALVAALALPAEHPYMDLTGGKDSRLVLAVALSAGLADQFVLRTAGPPDLKDVQLASGLAKAFGLRHESGLLWPVDDRPYIEKVTTFVEATSGMVNIWDQKAPRSSPAEVRVSGMSGECLRAHVPLRPPPTHEALYPTVRKQYLARSLSLLHPESQSALDQLLSEEIDDHGIDGANPLDRLGTFMIRTRARRYRGPMDDLESDFRIWPLASFQAVRAAYALTPEQRQDEYVHHEIMRRSSSTIVEYPFAGPGWSETNQRPQAVPRSPTTSATSVPKAKKPAKSEALIARGHRDRRDERKEFLAELFADQSNQAWDVVSRRESLAALDRIEALPMKQLRQLYAVATMLIWLRQS